MKTKQKNVLPIFTIFLSKNRIYPYHPDRKHLSRVYYVLKTNHIILEYLLFLSFQCVRQVVYYCMKKLIIPVAESLQIGIDSSSELTVIDIGSIVLTTRGNCLLVSSLLPSVDTVNGPVLILSASEF